MKFLTCALVCIATVATSLVNAQQLPDLGPVWRRDPIVLGRNLSPAPSGKGGSGNGGSTGDDSAVVDAEPDVVSIGGKGGSGNGGSAGDDSYTYKPYVASLGGKGGSGKGGSVGGDGDDDDDDDEPYVASLGGKGSSGKGGKGSSGKGGSVGGDDDEDAPEEVSRIGGGKGSSGKGGSGAGDDDNDDGDEIKDSDITATVASVGLKGSATQSSRLYARAASDDTSGGTTGYTSLSNDD